MVDSNEHLLIIDDSRSNADLFYRTRFLVDSPVIYLESGGQRTLLVNDLEYGRAGIEADIDELLSSTAIEDRLRQAGQPAHLVQVVHAFLQERGIRELVVPTSLAFGYGRKLVELGYTLETRDPPFFATRRVKNAEELRAIETTQEHIESSMRLAIDTIKGCEVRDGVLHRDGSALTSEALRLEIQKFLLERGCLATEVIVAGGDQGADPHRRGEGPLPGNQTIILDIFAQSLQTRYWGDMTRTVVRGNATDAVKKLFQDVHDAQEAAFQLVREGVDSREIHGAAADLLRARGNENGEEQGKKTGFFHGTGHGIGLEIHEAPRVGRLGTKLRAGNVITIEPGLYYPGVGAVRLEDVVVVTEDGHRNLNHVEKVLEI